MRTVCKNCNTEMVVDEIGTEVIVMFSNPPTPYRIINSDTHKCQMCGATVNTGFPDGYGIQHFEQGFKDYLYSVYHRGNYTICFEKREHSLAYGRGEYGSDLDLLGLIDVDEERDRRLEEAEDVDMEGWGSL